MNPLTALSRRRPPASPPAPAVADGGDPFPFPPARIAELRTLATGLATGLDARAQHQLDAFDVALQDHDATAVKRALEAMRDHLDLLDPVWRLQAALAAEPDPASTAPPTFRVGTLSLAAWHRGLMPPERELALSGLQVGPTEFSLDQAIRLDGHATAVTVDPTPASVYDALTRYQRCGYRLLAYAHSQPGTGPEATRPSGRDLATQRALERHYRAIGLIFSEDGYLRAYSDRLPFRLAVYGTNCEVIDDEQHLYRLHLS